MIKRWLCKLNFHKIKTIYEAVTKNTTNVVSSCKRCGKILDEYSVTTIGPFIFRLKQED